jgi:hypothetical protein
VTRNAIVRNEFLSEKDLDLRNLSDAELQAWSNEWLAMVQYMNENDKGSYSLVVFMLAEKSSSSGA